MILEKLVEEITNINDCEKRTEIYSKDEYTSLSKWLFRDGSESSGLEVRESSEGIRGVFSSRNIREHEEILKISKRFIITGELAKDSEIGLEIQSSRFCPASTYPFIACFILAEKKKGNNSFWKPWLDTLPSIEECRYTLPPCFSEDDLELLCGTQAYDIAQLRRSKDRAEFSELCHCVESFKDRFTFQEYVWARTLTTTRSYGILVDGAYMPALVPFGDMFNHSPNKECVWAYDSRRECFVISSCIAFQQNMPLHVFYGRKPNSRIMGIYGFFLADNDQVVIALDHECSLLFTNRTCLQTILPQIRSRILCQRNSKAIQSERPFLLSSRFCSTIYKKTASLALILKENCKLKTFDTFSCKCPSSFPSLCISCSNLYSSDIVEGKDIINELESLELLKSICLGQLSKYPSSVQEDQIFLEQLENLPSTRESDLKIRCIQYRLAEKLMFHNMVEMINKLTLMYSNNSDGVKTDDFPPSYQSYLNTTFQKLIYCTSRV